MKVPQMNSSFDNQNKAQKVYVSQNSSMRASIIEQNDEGQPIFIQGNIEHESPGVKRLMTK